MKWWVQLLIHFQKNWYFSGWGTRWQGCTLTHVLPCLQEHVYTPSLWQFLFQAIYHKDFFYKRQHHHFCIIVLYQVLTWWRSARLNFSKNSHFIKCFLAACMALRLLVRSLLVETPSNAGSLSFKKKSRLGFLSKQNGWDEIHEHCEVYFWYL